MTSFSKQELLKSLCCPIICILWGVVRLVVDYTSGVSEHVIGGGLYGISCFLAIVVGGILPIILILTHKIHIEDCLFKRVIAIVATYIVNGFIGTAGLPTSVDFLLHPMFMLVCVAAIIIQIKLCRNDYTDKRKRAVLILSDPILFCLIYHITFFISVEFLNGKITI